MRFLTATVVASSLLLAADPAAAPATLAEVRVADGQVLLAHWQATPIGRTWADPALGPVRALWAAGEEHVRQQTGATMGGWIEASSSTQVLVTDTAGSVPGFRASTDVGALATVVMQHLATLAQRQPPQVTATTVPGAAEAYQDAQHLATLARFGTALVAFGGGLSPVVGKLAPATADMTGRVAVEPTAAWLERLPVQDREARRIITQMVQQWKTQQVHQVQYRLELQRDGVLEVMSSDGRAAPGAMPVDRAVVACLHGATIAVLACGLDLPSAWKEHREELLTQWAPLVGRPATDPQAVETEINQVFTTMGLGVTVAQLADTKGTMLVALSPGMPVPGLTVVLPRSSAVDHLFEVAATKAQVGLPAEGASTPVMLPGVPLPMTVARTPSHWAITTDAQQAEALLSGKPGGWAESAAWKLALARAPAGAPLIGASDTPAFLRLISGTVGMAMGASRQSDPALTQAVLAGLARLGKEASTGYVVGGTRDQQNVLEVRSVTGLATLPALVVPLVMGKVNARPAGGRPAAGAAPAPAPAPEPAPKPGKDEQAF